MDCFVQVYDQTSPCLAPNRTGLLINLIITVLTRHNRSVILEWDVTISRVIGHGFTYELPLQTQCAIRCVCALPNGWQTIAFDSRTVYPTTTFPSIYIQSLIWSTIHHARCWTRCHFCWSAKWCIVPPSAVSCPCPRDRYLLCWAIHRYRYTPQCSRSSIHPDLRPPGVACPAAQCFHIVDADRRAVQWYAIHSCKDHTPTNIGERIGSTMYYNWASTRVKKTINMDGFQNIIYPLVFPYVVKNKQPSLHTVMVVGIEILSRRF